MRVIAGECRSLPLKTPKGEGTRPTADKIKETLFNILQNEVPGACFADFFAGSGGIGIEALSRGARKAYFIENGKEPLSCIGHNLQFTKLADRAVVLKSDAFAAVSRIYEKRVDIIFIDPPYGLGYDKRLLQLLYDAPWVGEESIVIVEEERDADFSGTESLGFTVYREKLYRTNKHVFLRKAQER